MVCAYLVQEPLSESSCNQNLSKEKLCKQTCMDHLESLRKIAYSPDVCPIVNVDDIDEKFGNLTRWCENPQNTDDSYENCISGEENELANCGMGLKLR